MLNKKNFLSPALLTAILFIAIVAFSACNNGGEAKKTEGDTATVKPPDTASTRPVIPPTKPQ